MCGSCASFLFVAGKKENDVTCQAVKKRDEPAMGFIPGVKRRIDEHRQQANHAARSPLSEERGSCLSAAAASPLQSGDHSTTKAGLRATGRDKL
jgi:hypothetical protein